MPSTATTRNFNPNSKPNLNPKPSPSPNSSSKPKPMSMSKPRSANSTSPPTVRSAGRPPNRSPPNRSPSGSPNRQPKAILGSSPPSKLGSSPPKVIVKPICLTGKTLDLDKIDVVMHHGNCFDGFGAAYVIWLYFKLKFGLERANAIRYIPCFHINENITGTKLRDMVAEICESVRGKHVIMVDFSYSYPILAELITEASAFFIGDHHKSAMAELVKIPDDLKIFDMGRSGAGIAWDIFFPGQPLPRFLAFIQDRDIWAKKLPDTDAFICYFYEQKQSFEIFDSYLDDAMVDNAITIGRTWWAYLNIIIDRNARKASCIIQNINGVYSIVAYANNPEHKSDIGNRIFDYHPHADFACVWNHNLRNDESWYSLRSTDDRYDISTIGKGHRNAAGRTLNGTRGWLPYDRVNDYGLLGAMRYATRGTLNLHKQAGQKPTLYVLFKVNKIAPEWTNADYLHLIKRKYADCTFIVFETTCTDTEEPVGSVEYHVLFNDSSEMDAEARLLLLTQNEEEPFFSFCSTRPFAELMEEMASTPIIGSIIDPCFESFFEQETEEESDDEESEEDEDEQETEEHTQQNN